MPRPKNIRPKHVVLYDKSTHKQVFYSRTLLKDINKLQRTTNLLIPRKSFSRIVREVLQSFSTDVVRFKSDGLMALQEATEMYLVQLFEDANMCASHANRVTVKPKDMDLVFRLRPINDPGIPDKPS